MRTVIVRADGSMPQVKDIENSLSSFYKEIGCSMINIVSLKIGGEYFDIICDEEGLLKEDPVVTAVNGNGEPALVGTLIITRFDGVDDVTDLRSGDAAIISKAIGLTIQRGELQPVITIEY